MKGQSPYKHMAGNFDKSIAFRAACDLVFHGKFQPSGYTEPLLHFNRLMKKFSDEDAFNALDVSDKTKFDAWAVSEGVDNIWTTYPDETITNDKDFEYLMDCFKSNTKYNQRHKTYFNK